MSHIVNQILGELTSLAQRINPEELDAMATLLYNTHKFYVISNQKLFLGEVHSLKIRDITLGAMLLAMALTVFVIESRIPVPVPIPGFKIGLSNIITLVTIYLWDKRYAFSFLMLRIILGAVICGSGMAVIYSAAGGSCSSEGVSTFLGSSTVKSKFG